MDEPKRYANLDISLHHLESDQYSVGLHFSLPQEESDVETSVGRPGIARFDIPALLAQESDPRAYGQSLSQALFGDERIKADYLSCQSTAQSQNLVLRLRLEIDPLAARLQNLHWETLADPSDGSLIATNETTLFSRYLTGRDWKPVKPRSMRELRGLVVVANPTDLNEYDLAAIEVDKEIELARQALGDVPIVTIPGAAAFASLNNMIDVLRQGQYELLYIVCHGKLVFDEPYLFLQDEEGKIARVSGASMVERLRELPSLPRLAILASCQSASAGSSGAGSSGDAAESALAAVGPRLAEGGVPAVIAMQGNFSMETSRRFFAEFFSELKADGQIDRAMTAARGLVRDQPDFWMPVLFMRLKSGRGWYQPGVGEGGRFKQWTGLVDYINRGVCTPILGPGLFEPVLGTLREIALSWAQKYNYPLAEYERESLPQVAQYLAVMQGIAFPINKYEEDLAGHILNRYQDILTQPMLDGVKNVDELIDLIGAHRRKDEPFDSYKALAGLPLPIFITTNLNNLLASALEEAGKKPEVEICPWNKELAGLESIFDRDQDYQPSVNRPLVYHLFGRLSVANSVVLTEDDYFSYLIGVTQNRERIPEIVRQVLNNSALLFLGFQMEEWIFRVLYQSLLKEPSSSRARYKHVAAQVEPSEDYFLEPSNAQKYLDTYFSNATTQISLYWGNTEEFLKELILQIEKEGRKGQFRFKLGGANA